MVSYKPRDDFDKICKSKETSIEKLLKLNDKLASVQIKLHKIDSPKLFSKSLRDTLANIRDRRNMVTKILGKLMPLNAGLRADLIRVERVIECEAALIIGNNMLPLAKNITEKQARTKTLIAPWYEKKCEIKSQIEILDSIISFAKIIREELKLAFEESSRSLASIDLEYRVSRSQA